MSNLLAPGYVVRRPRADETELVYAIIVASDIAEFGESHGYSLEELHDEWSDLDLDHDAWVVVAPDGTLAGYSNIRDRRHVRMDVEGYVHPDHFGRGIGTSFVRISETRAWEHVSLAPPNTRVVVNNWINAKNQGACALLEREGYEPVRYFWQMQADLDELPAAPSWPEGVTVHAMVVGEHDRLFYATVEEAMSDHWGHIPISFETWKQKRMRPGFDPSVWFLAMDGDESAGAALCSVSDGVGWVDILGVRRQWRRRGLGLALLQYAAGAFHRRGLKRYALGVDSENPSGATRLYERAGMHVVQQHATFGKELRPGRELTELEDDVVSQA